MINLTNQRIIYSDNTYTATADQRDGYFTLYRRFDVLFNTHDVYDIVDYLKKKLGVQQLRIKA